jgi:hypothetical protein
VSAVIGFGRHLACIYPDKTPPLHSSCHCTMNPSITFTSLRFHQSSVDLKLYVCPFTIPTVHPPPTTNRQPPSSRLYTLLRFPALTHTSRPGWNNQPRDPLDVSLLLVFLLSNLIRRLQFAATLSLPLNRPRANSASSPPLPSCRSLSIMFNHRSNARKP